MWCAIICFKPTATKSILAQPSECFACVLHTRKALLKVFGVRNLQTSLAEAARATTTTTALRLQRDGDTQEPRKVASKAAAAAAA